MNDQFPSDKLQYFNVDCIHCFCGLVSRYNAVSYTVVCIDFLDCTVLTNRFDINMRGFTYPLITIYLIYRIRFRGIG